MLDYLNDIDTEVLLAINGWHGTFQDAFWWLITAKWASALLVLALVSVEDYAVAMVDELEQENHHKERFTAAY